MFVKEVSGLDKKKKWLGLGNNGTCLGLLKIMVLG